MAGARLVLAIGLSALASACYLFSDEPKARKRADAGEADAPEAPVARGGEAAGRPPPPEVSDCPEYLTGSERQDRVIRSDCGSVRVRGRYAIDGGSLTLEAGTELRFEAGASLSVGADRPGTLHVVGTAQTPVRFVPDQPGERWAGVQLHAQARGSRLAELEIVAAGTETQGALWIAGEGIAVTGLRAREITGRALEIVAERGVSLLGADLPGSGAVVASTPGAAGGLLELRLEPTAHVAIVAGRIDEVVEWPALPYRIEGIVRIEGDAQAPAQLSLAPGASLAFTPLAGLVVGGLGPGTLSAEGRLPTVDPSQPAGGAGPDSSPGPSPGPEALGDEAVIFRAADAARPAAWSGLRVGAGGRLELRGAVLEHGGARDEGVIVAEGGAKLSITASLLRQNAVGVELRDDEAELLSLASTRFEAVPVALRTTATGLAAVAADNRFDADAEIHVVRSSVSRDVNWPRLDTAIHLLGDLTVGGGATLRVAPGTQLRIAPDVVIGVGYYERASLELRAEADAPIVLEPREADGADTHWGGIVLGNHTHKARFEHVRLRRARGAAGIELREGAEAMLVHVDCAGCAQATVRWDCASQIGNLAVSASLGTPIDMLAPQGCK